MISLFLDSSDKKVIVALLSGGKLIDSIIEENDNHLSEKFLPMIERIIAKNQLQIDNIDAIYVINGPGSFTGVIVDVTTAKVMAWGLKKRIIPISELALLATTLTNKKYIVPYIDARRNAVYAGIYDKNLNSVMADAYISIDNLMKKIDHIEDVEFVSYYNNIEHTTEPNIDIEKIVQKHYNDEGINPHQVVPNYLKRTEAEENYDKRSE